MNADQKTRTTRRAPVAAARTGAFTSLIAAACFTPACGGNAELEATNGPRLPQSDIASNASGAQHGSLALDVTYAGVAPGTLMARLSPLVADSAAPCRERCAIAPNDCVSECHPQWLAIDADTRWPGVSSLYIDAVSPGHYWLFAHIGLEPDQRAEPAPNDPVSRDAPVAIEIRSQQTASASLELDATFARGGAVPRRRSGCPLRLDRGLPVYPIGDRDRESATQCDFFATCSAADRRGACYEH